MTEVKNDPYTDEQREIARNLNITKDQLVWKVLTHIDAVMPDGKQKDAHKQLVKFSIRESMWRLAQQLDLYTLYCCKPIRDLAKNHKLDYEWILD